MQGTVVAVEDGYTLSPSPGKAPPRRSAGRSQGGGSARGSPVHPPQLPLQQSSGSRPVSLPVPAPAATEFFSPVRPAQAQSKARAVQQAAPEYDSSRSRYEFTEELFDSTPPRQPPPAATRAIARTPVRDAPISPGNGLVVPQLGGAGARANGQVRERHWAVPSTNTPSTTPTRHWTGQAYASPGRRPQAAASPTSHGRSAALRQPSRSPTATRRGRSPPPRTTQLASPSSYDAINRRGQGRGLSPSAGARGYGPPHSRSPSPRRSHMYGTAARSRSPSPGLDYEAERQQRREEEEEEEAAIRQQMHALRSKLQWPHAMPIGPSSQVPLQLPPQHYGEPSYGVSRGRDDGFDSLLTNLRGQLSFMEQQFSR